MNAENVRDDLIEFMLCLVIFILILLSGIPLIGAGSFAIGWLMRLYIAIYDKKKIKARHLAFLLLFVFVSYACIGLCLQDNRADYKIKYIEEKYLGD